MGTIEIHVDLPGPIGRRRRSGACSGCLSGSAISALPRRIIARAAARSIAAAPLSGPADILSAGPVICTPVSTECYVRCFGRPRAGVRDVNPELVTRRMA